MNTTCALALAYDGSDFSGWQHQPGRRTVQGELESALGRLYGERVRAAGSGRTDAGTHALGQTAAFTAPRRYPPPVIHRALSALLPADMRILRCAEVADGFDPRRDALERTYEYYLLPGGSLFFSRYALIVNDALDWDKTAAAARFLEGRRDFAALGSPVRPGGSTVRELRRCLLQEARGCRRLTVTADAFLRRMVRTIIGCLLAVGRGRMTLEGLLRLLESGERSRAPAAAPAHGLFLARVSYADFPYDPDPGPFGHLFG